MLRTIMSFSTTLMGKINKGDTILPISNNDMGLLKSLVPEGDHTYLVIRDPTGAEIVMATHTCSGILLTRGLDGTSDRAAPRGSCVSFEMTPAVVKDLICSHDCCEGECYCPPVKIEAVALPVARVGIPYLATAIASGGDPITMSVSGLPAWAEVSIGANHISITGTPTGKGSFLVTVAATNCAGSELDTYGGTLKVE